MDQSFVRPVYYLPACMYVQYTYAYNDAIELNPYIKLRDKPRVCGNPIRKQLSSDCDMVRFSKDNFGGNPNRVIFIVARETVNFRLVGHLFYRITKRSSSCFFFS